jgi:hypothetical protein
MYTLAAPMHDTAVIIAKFFSLAGYKIHIKKLYQRFVLYGLANFSGSGKVRLRATTVSVPLYGTA